MCYLQGLMSDEELDKVLDDAFSKLTTDSNVSLSAQKSVSTSESNSCEDKELDSMEQAFQKFLSSNLPEGSAGDFQQAMGDLDSMINEEDLNKLLESEEMDDFGNLLISQLTSKEIIYEPLKDIHGKFKDKESKQYTLITEIINIFECSNYEAQKKKNQQLVMDLLQQLQNEGPLPQELVGPLNGEEECKMM